MRTIEKIEYFESENAKRYKKTVESINKDINFFSEKQDIKKVDELENHLEEIKKEFSDYLRNSFCPRSVEVIRFRYMYVVKRRTKKSKRIRENVLFLKMKEVDFFGR